MNTEIEQLPGEEKKGQQTSGGEQSAAGGEEVQISPPRIDRPEGPFEHSGEASGWTKEEAEEKEQQSS